MHYLSIILLSLFSFTGQPGLQSDRVVKETLQVNGRERAYYLFTPKTARADSPLLVLLHGSRMNGRMLIDEWKSLANKEGLILAGPDSLTGSGWSLENDGPDVIYGVVEAIKSKYPVNPRRVYLFGYSAGAVYALQLSMIESQYFAGTAIYAGAMDPASFKRIEMAKRKIPVALFVSKDDPFFPLVAVRATAEALKQHGFTVLLKEIWIDDSAHGHDYFPVAGPVNRDSWKFLKNHQLDQEPSYRPYGKSQ
jgi:poly(3-hydroxybutyrate) depolymerase